MKSHKFAYVVLGSVLAVVATLLTVFSASAQGSDWNWTTLTPMPTERVPDVAAVNGTIYAIGGYNADYLTTVEAFDSNTNAWTAKTAMTTERHSAFVAAVGDKIYVIGGTAGSVGDYRDENEEYDPDPATDSWQTKKSMPAPALAYGKAVALDGKIYLIGGRKYTNKTPVNTVSVYHPISDTYSVVATMPISRALFGAAELDGKIYVAGGCTTGDCNASRIDRVDVYHPNTNTWETVGSLPTALHSVELVAVQGRLYAIGGSDASGLADSVYEYDPGADTWTNVSTVPTKRALAAIAVAGRVVTIGGTEVEGMSTQSTRRTIYVRASAADGGDGSSWGSAYNDLQDALTTAWNGDQIWVAQGVYYPDEGVGQTANERNSTFVLADGVALYGGFAGGEGSLAERNWQTNITVLSGDIDGDDGTDATGVITDTAHITGTNAYHVVTGSGVTTTAVLDGFTITGGNADSAYVSHCGDACGGGMWNENSSPTLSNVTFSGNSAKGGGGMYNWNNSSPTLTNVTFSGNSGSLGGGMYNDNSSPALSNVTFSGNSAESHGGGMYNWNNSSPTLTNVTFSGNSAIYYGGGMYNDNSSPALSNVTFSGNSATYRGGGMYNDNSSPALSNVTFSGNTTVDYGGGMSNWNNSSPTVQNSIFWNNQDSSGTLTPSANIYSTADSAVTITHSLVQGYGDTSNGNLDGTLLTNDPLFVEPLSPSDAPTTTGDLRLQIGSPAIDVGNNALVTEVTDLAGHPRIVNGTVDLGAYEAPSVPIFVDQAAVGPTHDGVTWTSAFTSVQDALDIAVPGIEIWVAEGVYYPDVGVGQTDNERNSTFVLADGVAVYGGFAGGEGSLAERNWQTNITVLSGDIDGDDGTDANGVITDTVHINGANAYHVVTGSGVTNTAVFDGFTITGGNANGAFVDRRGGGMYNNNSSPTLSNVTFSGNSATYGGGMSNNNSSPTLSNVTFSGNTAEGGGGMHNNNSSPALSNVTFSGNTVDSGGMYNQNNSSPTLSNVTFSGNSAVNDGGGMYNRNSSPTLSNVTFSGNTTVVYGGGMSNWNSSPALTNITFSGNSADGGGGMYNDNSSPTLSNVTFSGNSASFDGGGGMYNWNNSSPTLSNVTFSGNSADGGGGMLNRNSSPTLTNVTFSGNSADYGGGMSNYGNSSPTLTNVTFSGNSAADGGGMYNDNSSPTIQNSVVWDNRDSSGTVTASASISSTADSAITITHSLVQGFDDTSNGNLDGTLATNDPLFVEPLSPSDAPTTTGDLRLQPTSPAIDVGSNALLPQDEADLDGDGLFTETLPLDLDDYPRIVAARIFTPTVDQGAYEYRNQAPSAEAGGPYSGTEGSTIYLFPTCNDDIEVADCRIICDTGSVAAAAVSAIRVPCTYADDGLYTAQLVVADGPGLTDTDTAQVDVSNVAPTATFTAPTSVDEGDPIELALTAPSDPSSADSAAGFTYAFDCGSGYGAYDTDNTALCTADDSGPRTVKGKIRDKDGGESEYTAVVTVNETGENVAPIFTSTPLLSAGVAVSYTYNIVAEDADSGDTLSITAPTKPGWLTLNDAGDGTATLSGLPASSDVGQHAVALEVEDDAGLSDSQQFTITVLAVLPQTGAVEGVVFDDGDGDGQKGAGEPGIGGAKVELDGGTQAASGNSPAYHFQTTTNGAGQYSFAAVPVGDYALTVTAPSGYELADEAPMSVTVETGKTATAPVCPLAANVAPIFTSTPLLSAGVAVSYTYNIVAEDADSGDTLSITAPTKPGWLTLNDAGDGTATLSGLPASSDVGQHAVALEVEDDAGLSDRQQFTITVAAVLPQTGAVEGVVFDDGDGDGQKGAGEPGIGGAKVELDGGTQAASGNSPAYHFETTTNGAGQYSFAAVPVGDYAITVTAPPGYELADEAPMSVTVEAGKTATAPVCPLAAAEESLFLPVVQGGVAQARAAALSARRDLFLPAITR